MIQEMIIENWKFRRYFPRYDIKEKILFLKGKVSVSMLMEIKYLRSIYKLDIKDIRIN